MEGVRDECLGAVNDVVAAVTARDRLDALQVRPGGRLGHGDGGHQFAACHSRKVLALLGLGAMGENVVGDDALDACAEVHARASEFLQDDGLMGESSPAAAVSPGHVREQHPDAAGLRPGLRIGVVLLAPAGLLRDEVLPNELTNRLAEDSALRRSSRVIRSWERACFSCGEGGWRDVTGGKTLRSKVSRTSRMARPAVGNQTCARRTRPPRSFDSAR